MFLLHHGKKLLAACVFAFLPGLHGAALAAAEDPLEAVNRPVFVFNRQFDRFVMRPVNRAYDVLPLPVRASVDNFFTNISEPLNMVEGVLQADPQIAMASLSRFMINSTIGVLGLFDIAQTDGIPYQDQTAGKTLARWGVSAGPYLVIPFVGPSTARDAAGKAADWFIDPTDYIFTPSEQFAVVAGDALTDSDEKRAVIDSIYNDSTDPYNAMRAEFFRHEYEGTALRIPVEK